jgi:hypothetical protein
MRRVDVQRLLKRILHLGHHSLQGERDPRLLQLDRQRQDREADETRDEA